MQKLTECLHYCKADVKTGKPLIVTNMITNKKKNTSSWILKLFDKDGKPVTLKCTFNNSTGKAKASGARAVLQVWK